MTLTYSKEKPESVAALFGKIAKNYDTTNLALSLGLSHKWTRTMVTELRGYKQLGDLCAGTGDVALSFLKQNPKASATLYDFCPEMLEIAKERLKIFKRRTKIRCGDCHQLTFSNKSFDVLSMAYGLRNLQEPLTALKECRRVLKPEGKLVILELTRPKSQILYSLHKFYLKLFVPLIGTLFTKDKQAYCYLADSISNFFSPQKIEELLLEAGFKKITTRSLSFGIATIITAA
jgi:demethylmenaquinone methyltransferase/2-methoxy-6-polyprenyl-1,4-benzoquinol methylase